MVIGDIFFSGNRPGERQSGGHLYASAIARVSSFSIDLIFLFPLLNLVFVPFQRSAHRADYLDQNSLATFYILAGLFTMVGTYIFATALVSRYLEGTLGQRLLGLRVKSVSGEPLGLLTFLTRQVSLFFSLGLAALPLMSALYSKDHRTWVDRITGTWVESSSGKFAARWNETGALWAKSCSAIIVAGTLLLGLSLMGQQYMRAAAEGGAVSAQGCSDISAGSSNERLQEALTLFASGQVNEHCLDQEANWAVAKEGSLALVYLAKSFSRSKSNISDVYLNRVCQSADGSGQQMEIQACSFAKLVQNWTPWLERETPEKRVQTLLDIGAEYALVWGARQFFSRKWWVDTLKLLEPLSSNVKISEFVQVHKVRSLWSMGERAEVRELFAKTSGLWSEAPRRILAENICAEDLELKECQAAETASCQFYLRSAEGRKKLSKVDSALVLQILSCPAHMSLALSSKWEDKFHEELIPLWKAVKYLHQGDAQRARLILSGGKDLRDVLSPASPLSSISKEPFRSPSSKQNGEP